MRQEINHKLVQSSDLGVFLLYLATKSYDDAPKKRPDNRLNEGTTAPVSSFPIPSPFAGKTVEEVGEWLKAAPAEVDLDRRLFAVLDEHSESNDTITIARIGDGKTEGEEGYVAYFPVDAADASNYLNAMPAGGFDEWLEGYRRNCQRTGKPDLSKGKLAEGQS